MTIYYVLGFFGFHLVISILFFHVTWKSSFRIFRKKWISEALAGVSYFATAFAFREISEVNPVFHQQLLEGLILTQNKFSITLLHLALIQLAVFFALAFFYWRSTPETI